MQCSNPTAPQEILNNDKNIISSPTETPLENLPHSIVSEQKEKEKHQLNFVPLCNVIESLEQDAYKIGYNRESDDILVYVGKTCSASIFQRINNPKE